MLLSKDELFGCDFKEYLNLTKEFIEKWMALETKLNHLANQLPEQDRNELIKWVEEETVNSKDFIWFNPLD